jgi:molybdopterin-containing oxidoreductase family iron-sulfur binding subunit
MEDLIKVNMEKLAEEDNGKWGMVIDQDLCTGCQACVAACAMENNISFVGEEEAGYGRGMHWIRVERFWEGEYPDVAMTPFQPVLCQQCGSAPCEPVCPVFATVHSDVQEVNVQVYNRCVGTRFCAGNCPYQVRTFNWREWERPDPLSNQLNPDVTVRRRGVIEKCSFCIQRIRLGEDAAAAEGREVEDGEIEPACVQACPANAIIFGRLDDPDSQVSRLSHSGHGVQLLEELGTLPRVTYLKGGASHGSDI